MKKQSQFAPALKSVKSYLKGDYENKPAGRAEENKPKQSQSVRSVDAAPDDAPALSAKELPD
ncbi:MAG TPA: hypothetical protein VMX36_06250 [Sedimentisphaerales bacterium]|nr:hypothetical protein [Sedimentisphaerales bacterium]